MTGPWVDGQDVRKMAEHILGQGGAHVAPPWAIEASLDPTHWYQDNTHHAPLLIIGIGAYGKEVLTGFREFTRFHRSGFCWTEDKLMGLIITDDQGVANTDPFYFWRSIGQLESIEHLISAFFGGAHGANPSCVIVFDIKEDASFSNVKTLLASLQTISRQMNNLVTVSLMVRVYGNDLLVAKKQSARIRTFSLWQQNGRHQFGETNSTSLINHVFMLKQEDDQQAKKSVLCLYSLFHSGRPLQEMFQNPMPQNARMLAMDLRAVKVPYVALHRYTALKLSADILRRWFHVNQLTQSEQGRIAKDANVLGEYRNIQAAKDDRKWQLLANILNSLDETKWYKVALYAHWLGLNYHGISKFFNQIISLNLLTGKVYGDYMGQVLKALTQNAQDSVIRSLIEGNNVEAEIQALSAQYYAPDQMAILTEEIESMMTFRLGMANEPPCFTFTINNPRTVYSFSANSNDEELKRFLDGFLSYVDLRLEILLTNYLDRQPEDYLNITPAMEGFLATIPDAVPGLENNLKIYVASLQTEQGRNRFGMLAPLQFRAITKSGLAIVALGESHVDYKSYPRAVVYQQQNIDDLRLRNIFQLEPRDWRGNVIHEFQTRTIFYLHNLRSVELFFKALRACVLVYDVERQTWLISANEVANNPILLGRTMDQPEGSFASLLLPFRNFTLDGILPPGYDPMASNQYPETLNRLEAYLNNNRNENMAEVFTQDTIPDVAEIRDLYDLYCYYK